MVVEVCSLLWCEGGCESLFDGAGVWVFDKQEKAGVGVDGWSSPFFCGGFGVEVDEVGEWCVGVGVVEFFLCGEAGADEEGVWWDGLDDGAVDVFVGGVAVVPVAAAVRDGVGQVVWCGA